MTNPVHPYSFGDDQTHNGLGTPIMDGETAHAPEARDDIPPMMRPGMPLYNPALYEKKAPETATDDTADKSAPSTDKSATGTTKSGAK